MTADLTTTLFAALRTGRKLASDLPVPANLAACYSQQRRTVDAFAAFPGTGGGQPYGWKVGATNAGARQGLGADAPFYGRLLSGGRRQSGDSFDYAAMNHAVVECEFAIRLSHDLPPRATAYSVAEAREASAEIILSLEVVSTRFDSFPGAGVKRYICDNAAAGGWVAGPASASWKDLDFAATAVSLLIDGQEVVTGSGSAIDDGPFGMLAWLANQQVGLQAGDIISTGTATRPTAVQAGASVTGRFAGLGEVVANF